MTTTKITQCHLTPINLHEQNQYTTLHHQRILCGWDSSISDLDGWKQKQVEGLKGFFWIMIPTEDKETLINAGHISLDAYTDPADPDLARSDKSLLTIQNFFILPEYQSRGLGRQVMEVVEGMARREPHGDAHCQAITLTSLSKRYWYEEKHIRDRFGPGGPPYCNQEWYERLGRRI
ncbi:hypothetical protein BO94DRAFT_580493 [Aspergillus sclerotioniger CBS 115572]|uniref:N-acetyltransferase domain-containing protein n=1 Tax=Aspergillus sclerotioniger CBS 115572 TaxID=1450535 RepID=A0A317XFN2_9EURO|nr:hypothetical protein BO94DRAFT_580493 [Aspergillus sclerotioniger CBS 115572]PWY96662.1 hypothetical protein BO94DRAFT_580493 [Aspergillus sclerotioniger CBS 115572]